VEMRTEQPCNRHGIGFGMRNGRRNVFREKRLNARTVTHGGLDHGPGPYIYPPW